MNEIRYNRLYYGQFLCIAPLICILRGSEGILGILSIVSLGLISSYLAFNAVMLFQNLPNKILYLKTFYTGLIFVIVSSLLDNFVTLSCSPDLSEEGNFIVLMLFKIHTPLWLIYLIMLYFELSCMTLIISLWGCFLKMYDEIIDKIPYKSLFNTFKWLSGSGSVSVKKSFLNPKIDTYFAITIVTITFIAMQILRLYAALEWLEIIQISFSLRLSATILIVSSGLLSLICLTHYKVKKNIKI